MFVACVGGEALSRVNTSKRHQRRSLIFILHHPLTPIPPFNFAKMSIGVPIKVLHEAEGHTVTVETMLGEVYRGKLLEAEDNMNVQMEACTVTYRNGQTARLENVFIRGSKIRFLILPDMLKNAPMFKNMTGRKGGAAGSGKSAILRAQAARGRGRGGRGGRGWGPGGPMRR